MAKEAKTYSGAKDNKWCWENWITGPLSNTIPKNKLIMD